MKMTLAAALMSGTMILGSVAFADTPADTLVIADVLDDMKTLDPHEVGEVGGTLAANQIYQNLVTYDIGDPTKIIGVLAKSWEISEDGLTYTFKMNRDATFASGNPVTAHDAEYSIRRLVKINSEGGVGNNPFRASIITQFGLSAENVDEWVTAVDDDTLVMRTSEQFAPSFVLYCLSSSAGWIVDSKLVQEHEVDGDFGHGWLVSENSAGSGPFVLSRWKPGESVLLTRNDNYWGEMPAMKRMIFRHVAESASQRLMLENGDIDIANKLSPDDFDALSAKDTTRQVTGLSGTIFYMGLNAQRDPLSNVDVRRAIKYLVDYDGIASEIGRGSLEVHQTMLPRGFLGYVDYNPYSYDLSKAQELLGDAGIDGPVELDMVVWNTSPYVDMAQALQATLSTANINLKLDVVDGKQWLTKYRNSDFDIWLGLWGPDYPDPHTNAKAFSVNKEFASDGSEGLSERFGWYNAELSEATMAAVREKDTQRRQEMYEEIQVAHTDLSPFVYMFQELRSVGTRANVTGVVLGPTFSDNRYWAVEK